MMRKWPLSPRTSAVLLALMIILPIGGLIFFFNQSRPVPGANRSLAVLHHAPDAFTVAELSYARTIPTDAPSLLAGRQLYVTQCVTCHGAAGDGKSEYALGVDTPPLPDLRAHMAPGVHPDALIAAWISNGIPGTSMPGYSMVISEVEIVQLTAYLRTFGQQNPLVGVDPAALATEQARPPTPTPIPDVREPLPKLAFVRDNNLWYSAGDGTAPIALTTYNEQTLVQSPAFSSDGTQLAFLAVALPTDTQPAVVTTLHTVRTDGSALFMTLVQARQNTDGSYLQQSTIVRIDLGAGATPQLVLANARDLVFSPDGRTMAYVRVASDGLALAWELADHDGQNVRTLPVPRNTEELAAPRFSPNGATLLVAVRGLFPTAQPEPRNTANPATLAAWLHTILAPSAAQAHGTPWEIWAMDMASTELRRLTNLSEDEPHAVFSPDGNEIMVLGVTGLYRLDRDGAQLRRLDGQGSYGGLDWAAR